MAENDRYNKLSFELWDGNALKFTDRVSPEIKALAEASATARRAIVDKRDEFSTNQETEAAVFLIKDERRRTVGVAYGNRPPGTIQDKVVHANTDEVVAEGIKKPFPFHLVGIQMFDSFISKDDKRPRFIQHRGKDAKGENIIVWQIGVLKEPMEIELYGPDKPEHLQNTPVADQDYPRFKETVFGKFYYTPPYDKLMDLINNGISNGKLTLIDPPVLPAAPAVTPDIEPSSALSDAVAKAKNPHYAPPEKPTVEQSPSATPSVPQLKNGSGKSPTTPR